MIQGRYKPYYYLVYFIWFDYQPNSLPLNNPIYNTMKNILLFLLFCLPIWTYGQFDIAEPVVNTGNYLITDTVYMAPDGNDANPGTFALPVKSFSVALQMLPYGTAGVNGGNAYGLIRMHPGFYETATGFQQYSNNWQNGNTYRNVSIEGMGEVIIGGTANSFATGHLLVLTGNHIFIKNLKLRYSTGIGLLLSRPTAPASRQNHVLIENVQVDSVGNFSMLFKNVDTILVRNSSSFYASRPGNEHLVSPCQWPSGIKFFDCHESTIHNCEIAYTRGEGLNFHNSERADAYNNILHDNGLNFYNDNSAKLMVHHNLIYNTPGIGSQYWRNCPSDTNKVMASRGFLIANEGACDQGNGPVFENCSTKCTLPLEYFSNVDSMYVYNNILQHVGSAFGFWQGVTDIVGVNCIRNVFIFNNTVIGALGESGAPASAMVNFFFPNYNAVFNSFYGTMQNVNITHNIFTYDTLSYPLMAPVRTTFHAMHPGPLDITLDGNLWNKNHAFVGANGLVRTNLPVSTYMLRDSLYSITPCPENAAFIFNASAAFPFITNDYSYFPRNSPLTNVGAIEQRIICNPEPFALHPNEIQEFRVYPNPCFNCTSLFTTGLNAETPAYYQLHTVDGKIVADGNVWSSGEIPVRQVSPGMYFLVLRTGGNIYSQRVVIAK